MVGGGKAEYGARVGMVDGVIERGGKMSVVGVGGSGEWGVGGEDGWYWRKMVGIGER